MTSDIRFALRMFARNPGFALAVVLTLALGIGANTAIFSFIEAVLLRILPVSEPQELFFIAHGLGEPVTQTSSNYPYFERLRDRTDVFAGVTAYSTETFKVSTGGAVEVVAGDFVSGNYHGLLGVRMALGRGFTAEDHRAGADALIAVIGDSYWARRFARDPNILGRTITVQGRPVSIVGVTAPGFDGLQPGRRVDVALPLALRALDDPGLLNGARQPHQHAARRSSQGRRDPGAGARGGRICAPAIPVRTRESVVGGGGTTSLRRLPFSQRGAAKTICVRTTPLRSAC